MSGITNYSELIAAIRRYFPRSDDITADIELAITLFESYVDVSFWPQEKKNETTLSIVSGDSSVTLPSDILSVFDVTISGKNVIRSGTLKDIREARLEGHVGTPQIYAERIVHNNALSTDVITSALELFPTSDGNYTLTVVYWMKLLPLGVSQTTNWLLRLDPALYLYGCLSHIPPRFSDNDKMVTWDRMFKERMSAWMERESFRKNISSRVVKGRVGLLV